MRSRLPAAATARMASAARIQNRAPRVFADTTIPRKAAMAAAQTMPRSTFTRASTYRGDGASCLRCACRGVVSPQAERGEDAGRVRRGPEGRKPEQLLGGSQERVVVERLGVPRVVPHVGADDQEGDVAALVGGVLPADLALADVSSCALVDRNQDRGRLRVVDPASQ